MLQRVEKLCSPFMAYCVMTHLNALWTVPNCSMDRGQKLGDRKEGRVFNSNLESLPMPKMPTLAVKTIYEGKTGQ